MLQTLAVLALAAMSSVSAYTTEDLSLYEEDASDPRVFFANYTSGDEGLVCGGDETGGESLLSMRCTVCDCALVSGQSISTWSLIIIFLQ